MAQMSIIAAILGAIVYRLRGWSPPLPERWWKRRPILQTVFALPYGIVAYLHSDPIIALFAFILTIGAVITGHASYQDLGTSVRLPTDGQTDEWYGRWIPLEGSYIHDFIGLMVSGLLITAPCGVVLVSSGHLWAGIAVLASGLLKGPAYAIGRLIPVSDHLKTCEPICGAFLWGSLAMIAGL